MNHFYVYVYYHPLTNQPLYVGKGKGNRVDKHLKPTKLKTRFAIKVKSLMLQGITPQYYFYAENLSEDEAFDIESKLIIQYGRIDINTGILYNGTDGGGGTSGLIWSDTHRKNHKEARNNNLARPNAASHLGMYSISGGAVGERNPFYGHKHSKESLDKIQQAALTRKKLKCNYCGIECTVSNYRRWHDMKCKLFTNLKLLTDSTSPLA